VAYEYKIHLGGLKAGYVSKRYDANIKLNRGLKHGLHGLSSSLGMSETDNMYAMIVVASILMAGGAIILYKMYNQ
jgi:hypothetical protein